MAKSRKAKRVNPLNVIGEILGRKAEIGFNPASKDNLCPYIRTECKKRGKSVAGPYPVCSIWRGNGDSKDASRDLIPVCPKRFYEVDFLDKVIELCWPADNPPRNPRVAPEVQMKGFGKVDFVIADVDGEAISNFLSVELQAIDITGSVFKSYQAITTGAIDHETHGRGFNWDNVYKRYVTQLIRKGYFHHHWNSKIVAVIPEQVFQYIIDRASFITSTDVKSKESNIIFVTYVLVDDATKPGGGYRPKLVRCVGTSHSSLQSAMMYATAPSKTDFAQCIERSLTNEIKLADLIAAGKLRDTAVVVEGTINDDLPKDGFLF